MPATPPPLWGVRRDLRMLSAAVRPAPRGGHEIPPLPPGRALALPGRGTTFVRELPLAPDAPAHAADRPPVVLMHGWTMTADLNFHGVYDTLARDQPVIALDTRSHGRGLRGGRFSYDEVADDLACLLDVLGHDRAVFAGFSLGGVTSMVMALRHRDRVAGIVPQACALTYASLRRDRAVRRVLHALEPSAAAPPWAGISRRYWHDTLRRHPQLLPYRHWIESELALTSTPEMLETIDAVFRHDLRERAAALRGVPSAFVVLERDRVCHPRLQRAAATAIGAFPVPVAADHNIALTRPEQYGAALSRALAVVAERGQQSGDR